MATELLSAKDSDEEKTCASSDEDGYDSLSRETKVDRYLKNGQGVAGDVVWLGRRASTRLTGFKSLPGDIRGHQFVLLDVFRDAKGGDIAWICIISSMSSRRYQKDDLRHAVLYDADETAHRESAGDLATCNGLCGKDLSLDEGEMRRQSYVNLTRIYEWRLTRLHQTRRKLNRCSLQFMWRQAAHAIADKMVKLQFKMNNSRCYFGQPQEADLRPGQIYWLPGGGQTGRTATNLTPLRVNHPLACVLSRQLQTTTDVTWEVHVILDCRESQSDTDARQKLGRWVSQRSVVLPVTVSWRMAAAYKQTQSEKCSGAFMDEDDKLCRSHSALQDQVLLQFPPLEVAPSSLFELPASYRLGRKALHAVTLKLMQLRRASRYLIQGGFEKARGVEFDRYYRADAQLEMAKEELRLAETQEVQLQERKAVEAEERKAFATIIEAFASEL